MHCVPACCAPAGMLLRPHARTSWHTLCGAGPRCGTLLRGAAREACAAVLDSSAVVLMTEEEAQVVVARPARTTNGRSALAHVAPQDEACAAGPGVPNIAGARDAAAMCAALLRRPGCAVEWAVIKLGADGAMLARRCPKTGKITMHYQRSFSVRVRDTVGCGDAFAAAVRPTSMACHPLWMHVCDDATGHILSNRAAVLVQSGPSPLLRCSSTAGAPASCKEG
jgi:pfkB family carbohydrate kinase